MRRGTRVFLSLTFTLLLLYLFLRGVDFAGAWRETRSARPLWLAVGLVGSYLHYLLRAVRWRTLLSPAGKPVPLRVSLSCTAIGFFLSAILPGRPGEVVRPVLLGVRTGISRSFALATVLVERAFLDPLAILVLLSAAMIAGRAGFDVSPESAEMRRSVWAAGGILAAALAAGLALAAWGLARRQRLLAWLRRPERHSARRERLVDGLERFADGLAALGRGQVWPAVALGSLATWGAVALGMWGCMRAFHVDIGYPGAMVLVALAGVGVLLPTPGGVGGFHLAVQVGLTTLYGVSIDRSVPAALVTHLLLLLPALTIGAWSSWKQGLDLSSMWQGAMPNNLPDLVPETAQTSGKPARRVSGQAY
jgi:uncharacterized protein (TIRG00374 family)